MTVLKMEYLRWSLKNLSWGDTEISRQIGVSTEIDWLKRIIKSQESSSKLCKKLVFLKACFKNDYSENDTGKIEKPLRKKQKQILS